MTIGILYKRTNKHGWDSLVKPIKIPYNCCVLQHKENSFSHKNFTLHLHFILPLYGEFHSGMETTSVGTNILVNESLLGAIWTFLQNSGLRMRRECRERFPRHRLHKKTATWRSRHASRHVHYAHAVINVGIANSRWRGRHYRDSRRMRNPQFYISGKRPMANRSRCFKQFLAINELVSIMLFSG